VILVLAAAAAAVGQTPGSSPLNAAPIGKTIAGIVECGQGYTSHELYDMKITVLEVFRGEEAWARLKSASPANKQAAQGQEYVVARVRFEYYARGVPGACLHQVSPEQFTAFSAEGVDYKNTAAMAPKPELRKGMKSGEILEGWIAFEVAQQDKKPIVSYSADAGGAVVHGGGKWFQLY
jgi:hypothetical protein